MEESNSEARIRDFIYLDVEKVKSLLAQMQEGLLTGRSAETGTRKAVEARTGVKLPMLADIGGTGQYIWTNQETETKTLHDHIYNEAESALSGLKRLIRFPEDFDSASLSADSIRTGLSPSLMYSLTVGP